jgi:hypothetical protein
MFVGAINQYVRQFLGNVGETFKDRVVVVGCSGNFSLETIVSATSTPRALHSNDVSLYSCLLGSWLAGAPMPVTLRDAAYSWVAPYLDTPERTMACVLVLLDMLPYRQQTNAHQVRMWGNYLEAFPQLLTATLAKLQTVTTRITSFYAGDVLTHFERFADDDALFCCFPPTYSGGYERLYKPLDTLFTWPAPTYPRLDEARRSQLWEWLRARAYLWYDDRLLPEEQPVLQQQQRRMRTVYLYSNVVRRTAVLSAKRPPPLPDWPLASLATVLTPEVPCTLRQVTTAHLARYKDLYLSKAIAHDEARWSFVVEVGGVVVGCLEFRRDKYRADTGLVYLNADFPVAPTRYVRLSKLILMLAVCGETKQRLERAGQRRVHRVTTTAWTDRPVSMKYRGVLRLEGRGYTPDHRAFLTYSGPFTAHSFQEVYTRWLMTHGLRVSLPS